MGASELGWQCCKTLFEIGQNVVGIFSIPQEFRISWSPDKPVRNVLFKSFEDLAAGHNVPLIYVTGKMGEYKDALRQLQPDILIVVGWYYMLPRSLREIAPRGALGIHASLLPKYRGNSPLVWALINGETETGLSFFYFEDSVDSGDIVAQVKIPVDFEDTIATLVQKATDAAIQMIRDYVPLLAAGTAPRVPQDHSQATQVGARGPEDGLLHWNEKSALQAYNWIRAQTRPYPGAFSYMNGEKVMLWRAFPTDTANESATPGALLPVNVPDACGIWCADGRLLHLYEVEVNGQIMTGAAFAKRTASGAIFSTAADQ